MFGPWYNVGEVLRLGKDIVQITKIRPPQFYGGLGEPSYIVTYLNKPFIGRCEEFYLSYIEGQAKRLTREEKLELL